MSADLASFNNLQSKQNTAEIIAPNDSENWTAQDILKWSFATYSDIAIASAFGAEGVALIDMASYLCSDLRVFIVDTNFLFPQTYRLAAQMERRYRLKIEWVWPDLTPEQQATAYGPDLWISDPDRCCTIRKVEPLQRKVRELDAWITAIRRDQTGARARARKIERDQRFGLMKINPLLDWSSDQVWKYIRKHEVPYNALHDENFPSIGCIHCTRPVAPDQDARAGRWAGTRKTECGLHER